VHLYRMGSWGPRSANRILENGDTWFLPSS
jgi:hypothetical protein